MVFLKKKIRFLLNKKIDIVIYDECNFEILKNVIPSNYSCFVFNKRIPTFYLNFHIIFDFLKNLIHIKFHKTSLSYSLRQIKYTYEKSVIDFLNPAAVITYIDNSQSFSWIAQETKNRLFFSVQNGFRLSYESANNHYYFAQHLFSFGEFERDLFPKLKYKVEKFYPVGSLAGSLYRKYEAKEKIYDVLVISCWRGNIGFGKDVQDTMRSMRVMDKYLSIYFSKKKCKFAIITRSEKNSSDWFMKEIGLNEEQYYKKIYGEDAKIIETNFAKRNIYPVMLSSDLIITCLSTAALEAFGYGKKILYCNFHKNNTYHKDFHKDILYSGYSLDKSLFFKRIDDLISTPYPAYINSQKKIMKYYMAYPGSETTHSFIKRKISKLINETYK
jgi:surface carbohydrate biosynthesis protein